MLIVLLLTMEELTNIKIIAIFVLLVVALAFGIVPVFFMVRSAAFQDPERRRLLQRVIGGLNAFAGGFFMGVALLHLLPDVRQLMVDSLEMRDQEYTFDWAELCVAGGFFMVVFVEQITILCQEKFITHPVEEEPFASDHTSDEHVGYGEERDAILKTSFVDDDDDDEGSDFARSIKKRKISACSSKSVETSSAITSLSRHGSVSKSLEDFAFDQGHLTAGKAMILLISLSLHSIFEGLALGLQLSKEDLTDIFIAIALYKGVEAFIVALSLAQIKSTDSIKFVTASMIVFALMSPIGIAIGILIVSATENETGTGGTAHGLMVNGVLQGVATGTFMFVTFIEILPHELNTQKDRFAKSMCALVGFTAIALLNVLE